MFVRVTYTATVGANRETFTDGVILGQDGKLIVNFNKDIDWTQPVFVMLEPSFGLVNKEQLKLLNDTADRCETHCQEECESMCQQTDQTGEDHEKRD